MLGGTEYVGLEIGLMGLSMACYVGLRGVLSGLTKSADHPSSAHGARKLSISQLSLGVAPAQISLGISSLPMQLPIPAEGRSPLSR